MVLEFLNQVFTTWSNNKEEAKVAPSSINANLMPAGNLSEKQTSQTQESFVNKVRPQR